MGLQITDLELIEAKLGDKITDTMKQSVHRAIQRHKEMKWQPPTPVAPIVLGGYVSKEEYTQLNAKYDTILQVMSETNSYIEESAERYNALLHILDRMEKSTIIPVKLETESDAVVTELEALVQASKQNIASVDDVLSHIDSALQENNKINAEVTALVTLTQGAETTIKQLGDLVEQHATETTQQITHLQEIVSGHILTLGERVTQQYEETTKQNNKLHEVVKKFGADIVEKIEAVLQGNTLLSKAIEGCKGIVNKLTPKPVEVNETPTLVAREPKNLVAIVTECAAQIAVEDTVAPQIGTEPKDLTDIVKKCVAQIAVDETAAPQTTEEPVALHVESKSEVDPALDIIRWVELDLANTRKSIPAMSQAKLAQYFGISRSTYQHYERDGRLPVHLYEQLQTLITEGVA